MIFERFYDDGLAQASYLLGCAANREALIVDPNRDVEPYLRAAEREGLRIAHVTETHIHADFVSGARELAERTGAQLYLSGEGGPGWEYGFAREAGAVLLKDGNTIGLGNVRLSVLHTPGHTPEHLSFVVTDTAAADRPMGVFTGDFLFVGDVGRPDLLERAARQAGTMEEGARTLFRSLQRFRTALPDFVQVWPGHGAGSACGKSLSAVPQSTLGYEKLFNWGFQAEDEDEFVRAVLAGQPEPPMYFAEMKRINQRGPRLLGDLPHPRRLPADDLPDLLDRGALIVDTRSAAEYARTHLRGSYSVPLSEPSFPTWAGSVLPYDRDLYLVVGTGSEDAIRRAARELAMIGLDRVMGYFDAAALEQVIAPPCGAESVSRTAPEELHDLREDEGALVIDVRNSSEWEAGHIAGSLNVPLGRLPQRLEELPRDRPLVVHCQTGARAGVAVGALLANGFPDVRHLAGDYKGWRGSGRETVEGAPAPG